MHLPPHDGDAVTTTVDDDLLAMATRWEYLCILASAMHHMTHVQSTTVETESFPKRGGTRTNVHSNPNVNTHVHMLQLPKCGAHTAVLLQQHTYTAPPGASTRTAPAKMSPQRKRHGHGKRT
jgi:hypothetical protein